MVAPRPIITPQWSRWVLAGAMLPTCWLGMMAVHELGHILAAWLAGAKIEAVVLHPLAFSRTDVVGGRWPRVVIWMGPVAGMILPLFLWLAARSLRIGVAFAFRFFAGFCLLANGAYLASVMVEPVGDTADLLRLGESKVLMMLVGLPCMISGLACWSGQALAFGFGPQAEPVSPRLATGAVVVLVTIIVAQWVWTLLA